MPVERAGARSAALSGKIVVVGVQPKDYSNVRIVVRPFGEMIRARPEMYFGRCRRENPRLAGAVVDAVVADTLSLPDQAALQVDVVIESDHRFTVTDNVVNEMSKLDEYGLPFNRWALGALLAVSARTWIEIRTADRHWLQEFAGTTPVEPPREQQPTERFGTRITCELDHDYFPATTVLPAAADLLHARDDRVIVMDLRDQRPTH
ncbi:hypothetical protein GCM10009764_50850 [Nocardia ninae]|uniref:Uncharacterized protein n=1 Tax=Nocardia ninae NBRC 108245 TaxID=1210091 RepID=A0A511M6X2_9NOCA|nr:hypothetical protein NN4_04760 [Nocardia ninae NBRC 108245]